MYRFVPIQTPGKGQERFCFLTIASIRLETSYIYRNIENRLIAFPAPCCDESNSRTLNTKTSALDSRTHRWKDVFRRMGIEQDSSNDGTKVILKSCITLPTRLRVVTFFLFRNPAS